tara:strand:+ start:446 stop:643 length:198 start_codon:yes stop_codon:yes gene_type:complete
MIDTDDLDNMSRRDLVELLEAYNESLAEVERLQELLDAIHWDAFAEDDTTLEIDREVAERIRRGD